MRHHRKIQWPFQEPKLEVPTIYKTDFLGNVPTEYGLIWYVYVPPCIGSRRSPIDLNGDFIRKNADFMITKLLASHITLLTFGVMNDITMGSKKPCSIAFWKEP